MGPLFRGRSLTRSKLSLFSLRGRLLVLLSLPWGALRKSFSLSEAQEYRSVTLSFPFRKHLFFPPGVCSQLAGKTVVSSSQWLYLDSVMA